MNNHGIICKNNIMIIFLIILVISILILINKKVKFNVDFSVIGFEYNFCININYFFDIITLYKEDIIKFKNNYAKTNNYSINVKDYKWIVEYIDIYRINIETQIGLNDVFVTSMIIPLLSSFLAIGLQKYLPQSTKRFVIKPIYNKLYFSSKGAIYISIKLKDIIYIVYKILKKHSKETKENRKIKTKKVYE